MRSVNKVILIGNLTRDPEMKETQSGQPITTFGLATNREWVTNDSERKQSTEFHECVAWSKLAEICHKYLKKGKLVYVEGYLKTRSWETENGDKKFRTEIVLHDMIMLEKKGRDDDSDGSDNSDELLDEAPEVDDDKASNSESSSQKPSSSEEENVF